MNPDDVFLLVDDNADDVLIIQKIWRKAHLPNPLHALNSADDAILYLSGEGRYADRNRFPLPTVVLLDLRMPGRDGFDVLNWWRAHTRLKDIVFIALTGLEMIPDVSRAYACGASSYLVKRLSLDGIIDELVDTLGVIRKNNQRKKR